MVERKKSYWELHPEWVELLRKRVLQRTPFHQILAEMGNVPLTRNALIGKARRLGLIRLYKPKPSPYAYLRPKLVPPRPPKPRTRMHIDPNIEPTQFITHMFDIKENQCRWMSGEPDTLMFCGCPYHPTANGLSFCQYHAKQARQPGYKSGPTSYARVLKSVTGVWS
jgi:hypothetical protein